MLLAVFLLRRRDGSLESAVENIVTRSIWINSDTRVCVSNFFSSGKRLGRPSVLIRSRHGVPSRGYQFAARFPRRVRPGH
ncbi:hypothetical protein PUN28_000188 [Cardiocondyla obscurior]|uniref:Secreted protein n=1 Tax=Cardiocondyla obscurior TaxID=286306 RepID=A0AAW2GYL5_9HYME